MADPVKRAERNKRARERLADPVKRAESNKRARERMADPVKRAEKNKREVERRGKIRPEINKREVERSQKLKIDAMTHYSYGEAHCLHCGETETVFLTIDHINGRKAWNHPRKFRGKFLYGWLKRNAYPPGFQVLCWNWNQIKEKKWAEKGMSTKPVDVANQRTKRKLKNKVFTEYSPNDKPECSCCGYDEIDGLSIDHISGRTEKHGKGKDGQELWRSIRGKGLYKEFQVLCFNCNAAKSDTDICPHKKQLKS
jgi:5-methylcytosine-specific restriction endonuclease McrA